MKSYDSTSGRIGGGWWTGAVALSTVMTYRQATGDSSYDYAISEGFNKNRSGNFINEYLDDIGWWALAWIQAYDITGNTAYLQMAQTDANFMHTYWDSKCGGGIYWSTQKAYKASIANELFLQVTAALHNRIPGDTTYLGWANAEWNWLNGSGLINGSRLVIDGINVNNCSFNNSTFTYNQGVVLAGLAELSRATGNTGLLTTARSIADAATTRMVRNGILTENCEPSSCGADGPAFRASSCAGCGRWPRRRTPPPTTGSSKPRPTRSSPATPTARDSTAWCGRGQSRVNYNTQASAAAAWLPP
ncbi:glycoside hydrolase family 76 protein [Micromonospora sp. M12]